MGGAGGPGAGQDSTGGMSPQMANLLGLALMMASKGPVGSTPPGAALGANLLGQGMQEGWQAPERKARDAERKTLEEDRKAALEEKKQHDILDAYKVYSGLPGYTAVPQEGAQPAIPGQPFGGSTLPPLYYEKPDDLSGAYQAASGGDPAILAQVQGIRDPKTKLSVLKMLTEQAATNAANKKNQEMADIIRKRGQAGPADRMSAEDNLLPTPPKMDPFLASLMSWQVGRGQNLSDAETKMLLPEKKEGLTLPPGMQESQSSWKDEKGVTHTFKPPVPDKPEKVSDVREEAAGLLGFDLAKGLNKQGQKLTDKDRQDWTNKVNELERTRRAPIETPESKVNFDEKIGKIVDQRSAANEKKYKALNVDPPDISIYYALRASPEEYRSKYHAEKPGAAEIESMREERYRGIKDKIVGAGVPTADQRKSIDQVMALDGWPKRKAPDVSKVDTQKLTDFRDQWQSAHPPEKFVGKEIDVPGMPGVILRCDGTKWFPVVSGKPQGQK